MTTTSFIGGVDVDTAAHYDNINPSTGQVLGIVSRAGSAEVALAVDAARAAQPGWAATATSRRADAIDAFASLIRAHIDELSVLESEDTGKPIQ